MTEGSNEILRGQVLAVRTGKKNTFIDVGLPGEVATQIVTGVSDASETPNIGDIVQANGKIGETELSRRRQLDQTSLFAASEDVRILAASSRPRWPGKDTAERDAAQAAYIDMLRARHSYQKGLRDLLDDQDYTHVDTSILQDVSSGAAARTFDTPTNFDGRERHLRIAPEVDLKLVMALSGLERVYEIGRNFRNEGAGPLHHPEFTNLEAYTAYQTREEAIELTRDMLTVIAESAGRSGDFKKLDVKSLDELFAASGIDIERDLLSAIEKDDLGAAQQIARLHGIDPSGKGFIGIADQLFKKIVRPTIIKPTLVHGYLRDQMPLAASNKADPRLADSFQVIVEGAEVVKAYQEEVDPNELARKLARQAGESDEDEIRTDDRLIKACEMGLPPMFGIGIGLDRTVSILTRKAISDVIPMPLTRKL
jgi:lysyl-tRNA synthetase class 2